MTRSNRWSRALVTGASSGIGEELARRLAATGTALVVVARSGDRLEELGATLTAQHGIDVEVLPADLTAPDQRARVEDRLRSTDRAVDLLVNNAGFAVAGTFHELEITAPMSEVALNVEALMRLTRAGVSGMVERGHGGILNVASLAAFAAAPGFATYSATKAFVLSFSESLHHELVGTGVHVSALCPGFTRTEFQSTAGAEAEGIPDFLWMEAGEAAAAGLRALDRNQAVCVPGGLNRATVGMTKLLPRSVTNRVSRLLAERL